jgi:glutamate carboxypeptidase
MTGDLEQLVSCESPSHDEQATRACIEVFSTQLASRLDARAELVEVQGRTHLRCTWGEPRVLIVGHLDTVWPLGTLARWPFRIDGDVATGPGVFDMKAGVVQAVAALSLLGSLDGVRLLLTVDEELGSPSSAGLVVDSARGCLASLVCEPAADGAVKVARKGIAQYGIQVTGRAAHAGLEPEKGANAGIALAHAVIAASVLGAPSQGTTVTPTVLSAGTTGNTVPAGAHAHLDVRAADPGELDRVDRDLRAAVRQAQDAVPGTVLELTGGVNRPPMPESSSAGLFARAQAVWAGLGFEALQGVAVGGGSDGNFTAGAGVPTLDGLGAVGDGAHAEGEHVLVSQLAPRAQFLAALIDDLRKEA